MVVGAAKKSKPVGKDLERPFPEHQPVELHPLLQDPEYDVMPLGAGDVADIFLAGPFDELRHRHLLQFGDVGITLLERLVMVGHIDSILDLGGDLLGQRHRLLFEFVGRWGVGRGHGTPCGADPSARIAPESEE